MDSRGRLPPHMLLQFFNRYRVICIDAHFAGNLHRLFGNFAGGEFGVRCQRLGGGLGVRASAADGSYSTIGLDHVALSAKQKSLLLVAHQQQSFQVAQEFIGAPILGEFYGATSQVAVILLQLRFEAAEKREGVGGGTGESSEDLVVVQAANFFGRMFDDGFAERDLSIAGQNHAAVAADR
jgi:hypothetical protein